MPNPHTAENPEHRDLIQPNAENHYGVSRDNLPLHCPMDGMSLCNLHPQVCLSIEATGKA